MALAGLSAEDIELATRVIEVAAAIMTVPTGFLAS
jgi:hypothetical protein